MSHISVNELEGYDILTLQKLCGIFNLYNKNNLIQIIMFQENQSIQEMKSKTYNWDKFNQLWELDSQVEKDYKMAKEIHLEQTAQTINQNNNCLIIEDDNIFDNDFKQYQKNQDDEKEDNWLFNEIEKDIYI